MFQILLQLECTEDLDIQFIDMLLVIILLVIIVKKMHMVNILINYMIFFYLRINCIILIVFFLLKYLFLFVIFYIYLFLFKILLQFECTEDLDIQFIDMLLVIILLVIIVKKMHMVNILINYMIFFHLRRNCIILMVFFM